jgi:hypothetical protein
MEVIMSPESIEWDELGFPLFDRSDRDIIG